MEKIHYNILNEILKVYDFDSWDSTESEFKGVIKNSLNLTFIYKVKGRESRYQYNRTDYQIEPDVIWIFRSDHSNSWCEFPCYKDKVYIDGKNIRLNEWGETFQLFDPGEWPVIIKDLENLTWCEFMFSQTDIKEIPTGWDTKNITNMKYMFASCSSLTTVPFLNIENAREKTFRMFYHCYNLDRNTRKIWNPDKEHGEPGPGCPKALDC